MHSKGLLFFNTIRYLKPGQIFNRIKRRFIRVNVVLSTTPELSRLINTFQLSAYHQQTILSKDRFKFLNVIADIKIRKDWNSVNQDKLWLYNLHYFDDLHAVGASQRVDWHRGLIKRWINENPLGIGIGWEPYPSSLRIVNWIKWSLLGSDLKRNWLNSLAIQVRYLSQNLEYHILGNHLFSNAKALIFAGLYFQGPEAEKWYEIGIKIFNEELQEQVLSDGGNFELSPMYHAIFLEDLLDIVNIHQSFKKQSPHDIINKITHMFDWLRVMSHPDGEVSFFNDSAIGIAPNLIELEKYAERLTIPLSKKVEDTVHLQDSGYIQVQEGDLFALLDVARVGPDYIPGHAHADTLSFELSLFDERVIVNSGTSCYGSSTERLRQRGTPAHNTVLINGENSSEVWSGFRVARRAKPFDLNINKSEDRLQVSCSHDGYKRLKGSPVHTRKWEISSNQLIVNDVITGNFKQAEARYHFHPDVTIELNEVEKKGVVYLRNNNKVNFEVQSGSICIIDSTYHPEFGLSEDNKCLVLNFDSNQSNLRFFW
jgi:uncharacterized heparinase superfamily protein